MNDVASTVAYRLSAFGDATLAWIGQMNLWTAGLFVLAYALDRLLASRVAAGWRIALYLPILLRIALPADVSVPLPLLAPPPAVTVGSAAPIAAFASATPGMSSGASAPAASVTWTALLPLAYLAVVSVLAIRWRRDVERLAAVLEQCGPAPAWLRGLARDFDIVQHASNGPMLVGVRYPRLILPVGLGERVGADGLRAIVRHEASHVRRRDPLLAALVHAIVIVAWPVLALWCGASRIRTLMEMACDEHALRDADSETRRAYGRTLIDLASTAAASRGATGAALGFGGGLRERIASLRDSRHRWRSLGQGTVTALAVCVVAACGTAKVVERESPRETLDASSSAGAEEHELDFKILDETLTAAGEGDVTILQAREMSDLVKRHEGNVLSAPRLITLTGQPASITIGSEAGEIRLEAKVIRIESGVRTIALHYVETGDAGSPQQAVAECALTFKLVTDSAIEVPVHGKITRSVVLEARRPTTPGTAEAPMPSDIPLVGGTVMNTPATANVFCAIRIAEVDGPLHFAADNTLSEGGDGGADHRVVTNVAADALVDRLMRKSGSRTITAPSMLVRLGESASIESGPEFKTDSGPEVDHVDLRFMQRGRSLLVDLSWALAAGKAASKVVHTVHEVPLAGDEALVILVPSLDGHPAHSRVLILRSKAVPASETSATGR